MDVTMENEKAPIQNQKPTGSKRCVKIENLDLNKLGTVQICTV